MSPRLWRVSGVAVAVVVLLLAWFLAISPTLQSAAALDEETASQQAASAQLRSRISLLKKQSEELPAQEAILAEIQQRMPGSAALPTLIRNLTTVAENANVVVASVTPGRPAPVAQPAAAPAPVDDVSVDSSESSSSSGSAPAAPAAPSGPQVESMSVNISACGSFAQLRNYLRELESMKRVMMVSTVSIGRGSCGEGSAENDLTATIGAYVFTLPNMTPVTTSITAQGAGDAAKGNGNE